MSVAGRLGRRSLLRITIRVHVVYVKDLCSDTGASWIYLAMTMSAKRAAERVMSTEIPRPHHPNHRGAKPGWRHVKGDLRVWNNWVRPKIMGMENRLSPGFGDRRTGEKGPDAKLCKGESEV